LYVQRITDKSSGASYLARDSQRLPPAEIGVASRDAIIHVADLDTLSINERDIEPIEPKTTYLGGIMKKALIAAALLISSQAQAGISTTP
jgi:hypothetical protein